MFEASDAGASGRDSFLGRWNYDQPDSVTGRNIGV
jgi:hypothetical protein